MYISKESSKESNERLQEVLRSAEMKVFDEPYCFHEHSIQEIPFDENMLAIVRDDDSISSLVPYNGEEAEQFKVWRFHFKPNQDNSGFVGWLADLIKKKTGSGVFVVCGQNSNRGGVYDYWACPIEIGNEVLNRIKELRGS